MKNIYFCSRTSHEVRGLKYGFSFLCSAGISRTSHEVRGLKYINSRTVLSNAMSHLTRGAWIEMVMGQTGGTTMKVAPHTRCVD